MIYIEQQGAYQPLPYGTLPAVNTMDSMSRQCDRTYRLSCSILHGYARPRFSKRHLPSPWARACHHHTHIALMLPLPAAANKGIGFEIARLLSEQGLTTVVTSRDGRPYCFQA